MSVIEYWDKDGRKTNIPLKNLDNVTCDNRECSVFGSFYKCYNNHQSCGVYKNWMKECGRYNGRS